MKVPVYESQAQTRPADIPQLNTDFSPLAQTGRGLQQLGGEVQQDTGQIVQAYEHQKQKASALAITNAETQYQAFVNQQTEQLRAQKGQDALIHASGGQGADDASGQYGGAPSMYEQNEQQRAKIGASIADPRARALFDARTRGLQEAFRHSSEMYIDDQMDDAKKASAQGLQQTSLQGISNNYQNLDEVKRLVATPEGPITSLSLSKEDADGQIAKWQGRAFETAINTALQKKDLKTAQAYMADPEVRSKLGAQTANLDGRLELLSTQLAGGQAAQSILNSHVRPDGTLDRVGAYAEWDKMEEGPTKQDAFQQLGARMSMFDAARADQDKQSLGRVFQQIDGANGYLDRSSADFQGLTDFAKAQAVEKAKAIQRQQRGSDQESRRLQVEANHTARAAFGSMSLEDQLKANIDTDFPEVDKLTRYQLKGDQKKAALEAQKDGGAARQNFDKLISAKAVEMKFQKPIAANFKSYMVDWRNNFIEENKRVPTREDVDKGVSDALLYGDEKGGSILASDRYQFQNKMKGLDFIPFSPDEQKYGPNKTRSQAPASRVPAEDVVKIKDALGRAGKAVTEESIRRMYELKKAKAKP